MVYSKPLSIYYYTWKAPHKIPHKTLVTNSEQVAGEKQKRSILSKDKIPIFTKPIATENINNPNSTQAFTNKHALK